MEQSNQNAGSRAADGMPEGNAAAVDVDFIVVQFQLANNGQARISGLQDEKATAELRAELETFVCDGQFGDAMQRIYLKYSDYLLTIAKALLNNDKPTAEDVVHDVLVPLGIRDVPNGELEIEP